MFLSFIVCPNKDKSKTLSWRSYKTHFREPENKSLAFQLKINSFVNHILSTCFTVLTKDIQCLYLAQLGSAPSIQLNDFTALNVSTATRA